MKLFAPFAGFVLFLCAVTLQAWPQSASDPDRSEPAPGPRVTRAPSGVIVISGSSRQPAPLKEESAAEEHGKVKAEGGHEKAENESGAAAPKLPAERSVQSYIYGPSGNRAASRIGYRERNSDSSSSSLQTIRDIHGGDVPYLSQTEELLRRSPALEVSEQTVQRYDRGGNPTSKQIIREEVHTLADGTVQTTRTILEEDLNGHLRPAERVVSRETTAGNRTRRVTTAERPSINGGFRPYLREEAMETKTSETSAQFDAVRKLDDGSGTLIETEREQTTMTESGGTAHTESTVWKRVYATAKMEFHSKTVGKRIQRPDGSADESVEIYGFSIDDGPINSNAFSPQLQRTIEKQVRVGPEGEKVETSITRTRGIADHHILGSLERVKKVRRPTADGETLTTEVYQEGVNGDLVKSALIVEQVKK